LGQSLWLDSISRDLLTTGTLDRYVEELSVTGVTWNPIVFAHALRRSSAYDASIAAGTRQGRSSEELLFDIALEDLTKAADLLRPIYEHSAGVDGWISLQVSPLLVHDAAGTLAAAKALFTRARRPNVMIEIPGTPTGLVAIEGAIFAGVPVNVTLLFSREQYLAAAEAFLRGIERRIDAGLRPDIASVAATFVSHWDTVVAASVPQELQARLGIAMAQRTYKAYRDVLRSPRWQRIYNTGARPQRLAWAGTGPKGPKVSDLGYTSALTAQFTIMTVPENTLHALADRGDIKTLLRADGGSCEEMLAKFRAAGVDVYALALQLQEQGIRAFMSSWNDLVAVIESKAAALAADVPVERTHAR
jgi:transaldolase